MSHAEPILIGVDGGGTSCRAALAMSGRRIDLKGGPTNVSDFNGAIDRLRTLLDRLIGMAEVAEPDRVAIRIHLGLAGVMDDGIATRVAAALPFERVCVTDDQPTTIAGALGPEDGAVAAIGTGSFVGRQFGGQIRTIGGWGFLLGDEASGAWLGRRILGETLHVLDGLAEPSALTQEIAGELGQGAGVVAFALSASPAEFGALAPRVLAAAESGDPAARRLMGEGADYVRRALRALGHEAGATLCLTGGLGPVYAAYLPEALSQDVVEPRGTALDGALVLAARMAAGEGAI
ncbi:Glucosamine kinase GspK [Defluviimonas aquaemixtae]|uniref:Glucosamine kinase GspK n=1 Tax=Albidovulum aquaemixtae TaxID=1542388 RepID=A0A2R8B5F3_9RHOB|nr:BadF/BadG/BcrA/BcrD ATPase family protein [Defluviimonas aquaemixtae]SPH17817.1 Glucosamine kinase GspK [Defluviimonas aquaemixtae]